MSRLFAKNVMLPILDEAVLGKVQLADPGPGATALARLLGAGKSQRVEPFEPHFVELGVCGLRHLKLFLQSLIIKNCFKLEIIGTDYFTHYNIKDKVSLTEKGPIKLV